MSKDSLYRAKRIGRFFFFCSKKPGLSFKGESVTTEKFLLRTSGQSEPDGDKMKVCGRKLWDGIVVCSMKNSCAR